MKSSKSQIQSQVFIYIMVAIVAGGILLFGYKAIMQIKGSADTIMYTKFETTLKNDLNSLTYGAGKNKEYFLPSVVEQVCFKALGANKGSVSEEEVARFAKGQQISYTLIKNVIETTKSNVFIYPKGDKNFFAGINFDLGPSEIQNQQTLFKCFDVEQGSLKIRITGQGNSVLITGT